MDIKHIPLMPKRRYEIMQSYMPNVGSKGIDMMQRTSTIQANFDYSSEKDMIKKFRVSQSYNQSLWHYMLIHLF